MILLKLGLLRVFLFFRELPNLELPQDPSKPLEPLPVEDIPLPGPLKEKKEKQEGGRFKEKRVKSLASDTDNTKVTFKKRKLGSGARNTRQRDEDDWQRCIRIYVEWERVRETDFYIHNIIYMAIKMSHIGYQF